MLDWKEDNMKIRFLLVLIPVVLASFVTNAQNSHRDIAIERAKDVFYATANGDVAKLKQLMTPEFYKENYPYSDDKVREILLNVPLEKRERMIDQIKNMSKVSTIISHAGDIITVTLNNKVTNKGITVQLIDKNVSGDWKVFNYWY